MSVCCHRFKDRVSASRTENMLWVQTPNQEGRNACVQDSISVVTAKCIYRDAPTTATRASLPQVHMFSKHRAQFSGHKLYPCERLHRLLGTGTVQYRGFRVRNFSPDKPLNLERICDKYIRSVLVAFFSPDDLHQGFRRCKSCREHFESYGG